MKSGRYLSTDRARYQLKLCAKIIQGFLVGELLRHFLAVGGESLASPHSSTAKIETVPSGLFEPLTSTVGDLLIGRTHLGRVDLAAAELALDGTEGY